MEKKGSRGSLEASNRRPDGLDFMQAMGERLKQRAVEPLIAAYLSPVFKWEVGGQHDALARVGPAATSDKNSDLVLEQDSRTR